MFLTQEGIGRINERRRIVSINEILSSLRTEGFRLSNEKRNSITKKERLYQHIQTLFDIQNLTAQPIDIINITLIPDFKKIKVIISLLAEYR